MPRGGARPGAGRPRKNPAPAPEVPGGLLPEHFDDPKDFLRAVMNCPSVELRARAAAATALLPFEHRRMTEAGKKEGAADRARSAGAKFAAKAAPKLIVNNR